MPHEFSKNNAVPAWFAAGFDHVWLPYAQMKTVPLPLPVVRTEGARIELADGRELIDGIASWWTACHGYNHSFIKQAVEAQLAAMPHVMFGGLVHEQALRLAQRLARMLPGNLERVFYSDSGSVAVEVALKMAAQYWANRGAHGKNRFVAFKNGYHGDTAGAMAVTDTERGIHAAFQGVLAAQHVAALPDEPPAISAFEDLLDKHGGTIAGIIIEPLVQGAGGMRFHDARILRRLRALADRHNTLLIFEEIFTGF